MDQKHKRSDIRLFQLKKKMYVEEDTFKYFYPFCLTNIPVAACLLIRKQVKSWGSLVFIGLGLVEYVYLVFSFPIEAHCFHRAAL